RSSSSLTSTPPPSIYTLSLHDALPIWWRRPIPRAPSAQHDRAQVHAGSRAVDRELGPLGARPDRGLALDHRSRRLGLPPHTFVRSEEHTSELQSRGHLVCRLLLEKKKK